MKRADRYGEHRTAFEKNRQIILHTQNICGICGKEVDRSFKYPHPLSATVDHIVPVAKGGHPSELANLQLAHRWCNRWKSDKLIESMRQEQGQAVRKDKTISQNLPQHFDWFKYKVETVPATSREEKTL